MAQDWFFTRDGKSKHGPYSAAHLQAYAKSGHILPTDMVLMEDTTKWVQASAVAWLFPAPSSLLPEALPLATIMPEAVPVAPFSQPRTNASGDWAFSRYSPKLRAIVLGIAGLGLFLVLIIIARLKNGTTTSQSTTKPEQITKSGKQGNVARGFDATGSRRGGFLDSKGTIIIEYQFDVPSNFSDGLAPMKSNGKWGYIDRTGKYVIKPKYDRAGSFGEGLAGVQLNGKTLCIDKSEKIAFECEYPLVTFSGGVCLISKQMPPLQNDPLHLPRLLHGLADRTGKILVAPQYGLISDFSDGRAVVWLGKGKDSMSAIIDKTGKYVVQPSPLFIGHSDSSHIGFSEGLVAYSDESLMFDGYLDLNGGQAIPASKCRCEYVHAARFSDGLAKITRGAGTRALGGKEPFPSDYMRIGYIDRSGNNVIPPQYSAGGRFSEGLAAVQPSGMGKWGYIDKKGKFVVEPHFDGADVFVGGVAQVRVKDLYGLINARGQFVVQPQFTFIGPFSDGMAWFQWP